MSAAIQEPIPLTPRPPLPLGERGSKSEGVLARLISERPWLLTILFATLTLRAIVELRDQRPPWWVWALPVVYVLWANVHVQFVYGLFLLALSAVAPLIDSPLGRVAQGDSAA